MLGGVWPSHIAGSLTGVLGGGEERGGDIGLGLGEAIFGSAGSADIHIFLGDCCCCSSMESSWGGLSLRVWRGASWPLGGEGSNLISTYGFLRTKPITLCHLGSLEVKVA